jgi:hypothetical protein
MIKVFRNITLFLAVLLVQQACCQSDNIRCRNHTDSLFHFLKQECDFDRAEYEYFFLHSAEHEVYWRFLLSDETKESSDVCSSHKTIYSMVLIKLRLAYLVDGISNLCIKEFVPMDTNELYSDYLIQLTNGTKLTFRFDLRLLKTPKIIDIYDMTGTSLFFNF